MTAHPSPEEAAVGATAALTAAVCHDRLLKGRDASLDTAMAALTNALTYAATRSVSLDVTLVQELVTLRARYLDGSWRTVDEQAFWPAYHAFASSLGVRIDSIIFGRRWTRLIAWAAAIASFIVLVLLVDQLSFWASLNLTIDEYTKAESELLQARLAPTLAAPIGADEAVGAKSKTVALMAEGDEKCMRLMALFHLLSERVVHQRFFLLSKDLQETVVMPKNPADCLDAFTASSAQRAYVLGNAKILRVARQDYVLPVLFGLLGTIAFLLRSLAADIRDGKLTVTALVGSSIRIPLGMLAGLALGWVLGSPLDGSFRQITPWALAFVAGYSVELLFSAMDRMINAFSGEARPLASIAPPPNAP